MKLFYKAVRFLKSISTAELPIKIKRVNMENLDGSCEEKKSYFLIKINKELDENHAIDVLLHEMAHADAWGKDQDVHGKNWGLSYSRIYRKYDEKFLQ